MLPSLVPYVPVIRRTALAAFVTACALLPAPLYADNTATSPVNPQGLPGGFTLQAVGTETGSFDSNPLLLLTGAKALFGSTTSPELIINDITPTLKLSTDTLINENLFNLSQFDSTDAHETAEFRDQKQRWGADLLGHMDYDTTRTSELSTFGINQASVRHFGLSLAPQITFSPTAVDQLSLAGSGQMSHYDSSTFTDYDLFSVTPSYTHNFDPLNAGVISLQAQQYNTQTGPKITIESVGPSIGWVGILTPRLTAKANVGMQTTRQYGSGTTTPSSWQAQYTFSGDLTFKGQQDTTDFAVSRADYPFSNGTESLLTALTVTESHALNPRFSLNVGGSYQTADYPVNSPGSLDTLMSANAGLTYHATDHIDVTGGYQFRYESLVSVSANPQDHTATIGIAYHPTAWKL